MGNECPFVPLNFEGLSGVRFLSFYVYMLRYSEGEWVRNAGIVYCIEIHPCKGPLRQATGSFFVNDTIRCTLTRHRYFQRK